MEIHFFQKCDIFVIFFNFCNQFQILINAALGFDTFMVMRHGLKQAESEAPSCTEEISAAKVRIPGHRLGCYFCSDVVAPGDVSKVGCK